MVKECSTLHKIITNGGPQKTCLEAITLVLTLATSSKVIDIKIKKKHSSSKLEVLDNSNMLIIIYAMGFYVNSCHSAYLREGHSHHHYKGTTYPSIILNNLYLQQQRWFIYVQWYKRNTL